MRDGVWKRSDEENGDLNLIGSDKKKRHNNTLLIYFSKIR